MRRLAVVLILINLLLRFLQLSSIPAAISHDEVYYMVEARSIALHGSDLSGTWKPWYLKPAHGLFAELPGTVLSVGSLLFPDEPVIAARFVHAVLGSIMPVLLGLIAWKLFKNKQLAMIVAVSASLNPWLFQMSRLGFDAFLSVFFYLLAVALFLSLKQWWKLAAVLPLTLGFFQYQGLKVIFVPLVLTVVGYLLWEDRVHLQKRRWRKAAPMLAVCLVSILLLVGYVIRIGAQTEANRINDLIFFQKELLQTQVNTERTQSFSSEFTRFFSNKWTAISAVFLRHYAEAFSPSQLFIQGDPVRNSTTVWKHGLFYLIDVIGILVGLFYLWWKKEWRSKAILLTSWMLLAPLPAAINAVHAWTLYRAAWLFPTLIMISAIGWFAIWKHTNRWVLYGLGGLYVLMILNFFYQYFYHYPIYSTANDYFAKRVAASYIHRIAAEKEVKVLGEEAEFWFYEYLAFNPQLQTDNRAGVQQAVQTKQYVLNNVGFATLCLDSADVDDGKVMVVDNTVSLCPSSKLPTELKKLQLPSLVTNGTVFTIYNDPVCADYQLNTFVHVSQNVLEVEKLSNEEFCETFFTAELVKS